MTVWRGSLFFQLATYSGVGCQSSVLTCSSLMTVWRGSLFFQLATHSGVGCQSSAALLEVLEVRLSNFLTQKILCYLRLTGASLFYNIYIRFLLFLFRNTILKDNLSFYYCNLCTCISKLLLNSCFHVDFDVKVTGRESHVLCGKKTNLCAGGWAA